ncbi:MAG TPA: DUF3577 domain-containing protein [Acidiferrobacterales bacterium]|nr:DUF3577 domain-containing protein [Acidiferrobacterales bacterium]
MNQAATQSNPAQGNGQAKYFDLHTEGLGYLNRIRVVPVKKGEGYLCCAISALRGAAEEPEYTYFDLKVSGAAAKQAVGRLRTAVDNGQKVLIGFKAGDTYPEVFTYESGPKKGQTGVSTKGRLLKVRWARIEGVPVELPSDEPPAGHEPDTAHLRPEHSVSGKSEPTVGA